MIYILSCYGFINQFTRYLRFTNVLDTFNAIYDLKSKIPNIENDFVNQFHYHLRDLEITNPNLITKEFIGNMDTSLIYSKLLNMIEKNLIDGVSIDQESKFVYVIDIYHGTEILNENIHYVKIIPLHIDKLIELLQIHKIPFDVI